MTLYVDPLKSYPHSRGRQWCHLMSDTSLTELHSLARIIGLKLSWFQDRPGLPHYDLTASKRKLALANGAIEVSSNEMVRKCRA